VTWAGLLAACLFQMTAKCAEPEAKQKAAPSGDLTEIPIEELMNIEVVSPGRTPQKVSQTTAAVAVITQEEIRRSGARTIAEALRMAPGLDVARIDSSRWAISSRGFNDFFANKLLVLMDGRSVYTPLFSGVFWDVQDTLLEDIDRIEVIRGPGATLWGANAVNGVINIITKNSRNTQGALITGGAGNEETGFGGIRYGGKLGENAYYRAYVKYFNHDDFVDLTGKDGADEWQMWRTGFRTDWKVSETDALRLQGDYYTGAAGQQVTVLVQPTFPPPVFARTLSGSADVSGGNVLASWKHDFSDTSDMGLQMYYDRTDRRDRVHEEGRDTYDLDFQHRFGLGERQEILWGLGYRYTQDHLRDGKDGTGSILFEPDSRGVQLYSSFLQDEITLWPDRLKFTVGSKFEHNDYTGFEVQPNARLLWTPDEKQSIWAAVSRAVRTPARFEHNLMTWFAQPPNFLPPAILTGNSDFESEKLIAYELGYRVQPLRRVSFDVAGFYNVYDDLRIIAPFGSIPSPPPLPATTLYQVENGMKGETYGIEIATTWNPTDFWKLSAGYTFLEMQMHRTQATVTPGTAEYLEGESPQHQFQLRSYLDLPHHVQLDSAAYYVDNLPARHVENYIRWDGRLGWQPVTNFDISFVVQNILDDRHQEFGPGFLVTPMQIERSYFVQLTWRF